MRSTQPNAAGTPRICRTCQQSKSQTEYYRRSNGYLRTECKVCIRAKTAQAKRENPERFKDASWAKKLREYGITPEIYDDILASQGGVCAICKRENPHPSGVRLNTDHCHDTGMVRGILCIRCNNGLGWIDTVGVEAVVAYLESMPSAMFEPEA